MAIELPEELAEWASTPGAGKFLAALRDKLSKTRNPTGFLRLPKPLTTDERADLIALFGLNRDVVRVDAVHLGRADDAARRSRFGIPLRQILISTSGPIITQRAKMRYRDMQRRAAVTGRRLALQEVMRDVPQLHWELDLLRALPPSTTNSVPVGTRTRAGAWSTYETAIRAAAVWFPRTAAGLKIHERGLAVDAFSNSKKWTAAGQLAFQNLIGKPFSQAVKVSDTPIRLRGPMVWSYHDVICDAAAARPWIDVPARGVQSHGVLTGTPDGLLLVENQENFERVCIETDVADGWLCVWIQGFASKGLVQFVQRLPDVKLSAWCDLDPPGIRIIKNLMDETGRHVQPVGMEPELWAAAVKLDESDEDRGNWRREAAGLMFDGPPLLRELAARIAETGERAEQEGSTICDQVLPDLAVRLNVAQNERY